MAEKKFSGRTFRTAPLLATQAIVLQARIMSAAGPALSRLGEVFAGMGKDASDEQKARANGAAIDAFASIFATVAPHDLAALIKDVVETTQIQRPTGYEGVDMDGDFPPEHMQDLYPVAVWALREQFGPFFSELLANGSLAKLARG